MTKIEKLTAEQEKQVVEYRERFFKSATDCRPTDRERARKAGLRLAELGGLKNCQVTFIKNPSEVPEVMKSLRGSLSESPWYSFSGESLRYSLGESLSKSLRYLLNESLRYSLRDSLLESLRESLWNSLHDSGWTALYSYAVNELGIECTPKHREIMELYCEIAEAAFAVWIVPGTVIICDKPRITEVENGKLVNIEW